MSRQPVKKILPWSLHKSDGYLGQFARAERWYERACGTTEPEEVEDYLYAFFQGCHSLQDWLPEKEFPKTRIQAFVERNPEIRLCRDLANLTKHHELTQRPSTGAEPTIARTYVPGGHGWFGTDAALVALTDLSDRPYDLRELAGRCLALWREFLAGTVEPSVADGAAPRR